MCLDLYIIHLNSVLNFIPFISAEHDQQCFLFLQNLTILIYLRSMFLVGSLMNPSPNNYREKKRRRIPSKQDVYLLKDICPGLAIIIITPLCLLLIRVNMQYYHSSFRDRGRYTGCLMTAAITRIMVQLYRTHFIIVFAIFHCKIVTLRTLASTYLVQITAVYHRHSKWRVIYS